MSPTPSHAWWFTVNECNVARPLTTVGAASREWHCGQIGAGGWIRYEQLAHWRKRSFPSFPDVQKKPLSSSVVGSTRNTVSGIVGHPLGAGLGGHRVT